MNQTEMHSDDTHDLELEAGARMIGLDTKRRQGLIDTLRQECKSRGFTYERDGQPELISYGAVPIVMTDAQAQEIHRLAMSVRRIQARMPDLWLAHPAAREILPFSPQEEDWLRETWTPDHHRAQGIISRLDADIKLTRGVLESTKFFEYNGVAVGGLYYAHVAESLCEEYVMPALGLAGLHRGPEIPLMILKEIRRQGRALGRPVRRIAIVENKDWDSGITEAPQYARIFAENGCETSVLDPRDMELRRGEIHCRGASFDFFYRHMEVRDLVELEATHGRLDAMRHAFKANRAISSLSGEFDHKACWEVVADPGFASELPAADRERVLAYIPWTRVVRDTATTMPDGQSQDLLETIRRDRERYVIKPNRECGGIGVTIGIRTDASSWDKAIESALDLPGEWVVQAFVENATKRFPFAAGTAGYEIADRYVAYGFAATEDGLGCLGRFSTDRVINVSQGGGILPVMRLR